MRCPDCTVDLEIFAKGGHELFVCPQCFSSLLPAQAAARALKHFCTQEIVSLLLERITDDSLAHNKELLRPHAELACPKCKSYMRQSDLDKKIRFLVNQCISCHALWLNALQAPLLAIALREKTADDESFVATVEALYKTLAAKRAARPRSIDEIVAPFIVPSKRRATPAQLGALLGSLPAVTRKILLACGAIMLVILLLTILERLF